MGVPRGDVRTSLIVGIMSKLSHGGLTCRSFASLRTTSFGACARRALSLGAAALAALPHLAPGQNASLPRSARDSGSLTIAYVLGAATRAHPLVLAADARVRAAHGMRTTAGTFGNPVLTYQVENAPFPGRAAPAGLVQETSTYATLPLEQFWQRSSRVGRANDEVQAAEADLTMTRRAVALDAARAFHRLALAQHSAEATAEVLVGLDSLLRYTRSRVTEGATAEGDLLRLQVERDRVATDQALQEAELAQARATLHPYLMGTNDPASAVESLVSLRVAANDRIGAGGERTGANLFSATLLPVRAGLAERALAARPDVLAARARARAAGADVGLQRALTVRQLGATFGSKSIGGSPTMIAGLSVPIPLFDQNRGEIQRAQSERMAVEQELVWTERRAAAEVTGAYVAAQVLTERVAALQSDFLARAEESRKVALAAYREGAVPLLFVLDATRTLVEARLGLLRAHHAQQVAVLSLYVAAGLDPSDALTTTAKATTP